MPKHRKKKKSASSTGPYNVKKKTSDHQTVESNPAQDTYCDKCTQSVDQLTQRENCEIWFCSTCEKYVHKLWR